MVLVCLTVLHCNWLAFLPMTLIYFFQTFGGQCYKSKLYKKITWGRFRPQNSFQPTFFPPVAHTGPGNEAGTATVCTCSEDEAGREMVPRGTGKLHIWGELLRFLRIVSPPNPALSPIARKKVELPELLFIQPSQSAWKRSNIAPITDRERKRPKVWWLHHDYVKCERSSTCK